MDDNNTEEEYLFADEVLSLINGENNDLTETEDKTKRDLSETNPKILKLIDENEDIFGVETNSIDTSIESNVKSSVEELFGELSDEELDSKEYLTKEGKVISDNLKSNSKSLSLFETNKPKDQKRFWTKNKPKNCDQSSNDDSLRDIFSGIRLINPLISSNGMKELMSGRKMIKMSLIKTNINKSTNDIDGDWVTIGVIVAKVGPKVGKNGKQFSILKLSDLKTKNIVTFFLFGDVYAEHWKLAVSSVVGLLNPTIMSDGNGNSNYNSKYSKNEICSITVDNSAKLLLMGTAKDLGYCKAVKKNQEVCGALINLAEEDYCVYHMKNTYKKFCSKRPEIQATFSNVEPKGYSNPTNYGLFSNTSEPKDMPLIETKKFNKTEFKDKKENETKNLTKVMKNPISKAALNLSLSVNETQNNKEKRASAAISAKDVFNSIKRDKNSFGFTQFVVPTLAKGYKKGESIELSSKSDAKLRAIQALKAKPIQLEDPNAIRKQKNKRSLDKIKAKIDSELNESSIESEKEERIKKFKSDLIEKALNRKSLHESEVEIAEITAQQKYFDSLEKKEKMENKLSETLEIECIAISCHNCKYTAHSASELCKKSGHKLIRHKATKRFFKCKNCRNRSFTFNLLMPAKPCSKCGQTSYAKASIVNIKDETTLLDKRLLIRGEEKQFINS